MSVIGSGDWRKVRRRGSVALIWIGTDSWRELSISIVVERARKRWSTYVPFWQWQKQFCVWAYMARTETSTSVNDQAGRTQTFICAATESQNTMPTKTGNILVQMCLKGERKPWLKPESIVLQENMK